MSLSLFIRKDPGARVQDTRDIAAITFELIISCRP